MKKYDGVLKRVRELEEKNGIVYAKTNGALYKTLKVFYTIIFIWSFLMNSITALSYIFRYQSISNKAEIKDMIITIVAATVALLIGYVLNCVKCYLAGAIATVASVSILLPFFINLFKESLVIFEWALPIYLRYLAPLSLIVFLDIWMTVIALRAQRKTDKQYKKVLENLFNEQSGDDSKPVSEEEWDSFLENYKPNER